MSVQSKAERLFEFISQVYSIDLPVNRDITKYGMELLWQADIVESQQCEMKEFDEGKGNLENPDSSDTASEDVWLSVVKRSHDNPPQLPPILEEWINLSSNPTIRPSPKPLLLKAVPFNADKTRVMAFNDYIKSWEKWKQSETDNKPLVPDVLFGWIQEVDGRPVPIERLEIEEKFGDDKSRSDTFSTYLDGPWQSWSTRVLPLFKANVLYDQLFSLHQRLGVEGDRLEILWGHLFLAWSHDPGDNVYHPLILTPVNLHFDPMRRNISLTPSQTITTKLDLDCLINLDYPLKEELIKYSIIVNGGEPPDPWAHNQMRGHSATITGYLSKESADKTNLYSEEPVSRPSSKADPAIFNAPVIFVRERTRRLWVDDARKVAEAIYKGSEIPPFIRSLVADPHTSELPDPEQYTDHSGSDEDDGEHLLPLEYNNQQEEIVKKLRKRFGVLVQGPPGTGKSHTIANIISSSLARGKRVLVTTQTENALRVLRDYIPEQIRSLCVSHLGNDTESKKQLNEAVDALGKHLSEKNSLVVEKKIDQLKKDLRFIREEQARLQSQIKEWVEIDSRTINIAGDTISTLQAAKECSEREADHSWFPDRISPETEPPLNEEELHEMCRLLKEISFQDRRSCLQYLPQKDILTPEAFSKILAELRSLRALTLETEQLRSEWGEELDQAQYANLTNAKALLEDALLSLQELRHPWQRKILELTESGVNQDEFWRALSKQCTAYKDFAWQAFKMIQGYKILVKDLPSDLDIEATVEELNRKIKSGKKPTNWLTRITLSKGAKLLFDSVTVDDHRLLTSERIDVVKAYFSYKKHISKITTVWNKTIKTVEGPTLELASAMPLAKIEENVKYVCCPIEWKDKYFEKIKDILVPLGFRKQVLCKQETVEECLKALEGQIAQIRERGAIQYLRGYKDSLSKEAIKEGAHSLWTQFSKAVDDQSMDKYEEAFAELMRLHRLCDKVQRLENLSNRLRKVAPIWYSILEKKAMDQGEQALEKDWSTAWRWRRLTEWLDWLHSRESVESLQSRLERARRKQHELIIQHVNERTWQRQLANVRDYHYRALTAWADAMRKYGKTGGKFAQRWLAAASKAMVDAVGAVPAWIMPLHRVVQSFPAEAGIFDLVIVDEASQCDMRALPVLFRAKKVLVVGDPEQISPTSIGVERSKVFELIKQFLSDVPYAGTTFLIDNSLYHITQGIPRMDRTLLTEHFRCVPQIIEFNNRLCPSYAGKLEPLRQPNPVERLDPSINTIHVPNGFKDNNDVNKPEAEALVELLVGCCRDERYLRGGKDNRKRTMGVVSLLGEKQAKYISELISQRLEETERAERRIICGDAYAFQGDERDIMFLSLTVAPNAPFAPLVKDTDRQRFNVATSRARDQVFLFHSVRLNDIMNPECVRYRLLDWYLKPPISEIEHGLEVLKKFAESDFEIEVGERIIRRGYKVLPQFKPLPNDFNYRIDLVVQGEKSRVGVECDGDRYHGPEKWENDQRRETQLRRAGWKFWRISGSAFYRNKDKALESLWRFLEEEGINPVNLSDVSGGQTRNGVRPSTSGENLTRDETPEETEGKKPNGTTDRESKAEHCTEEGSKKKENTKQNQPGAPNKTDLFSASKDWRAWQLLVEWATKTNQIESHGRSIGYQVVDKLKLGRKISPWLQKEMDYILTFP